MLNDYFSKAKNEPYRIMFPLGAIFLLWGILIWLPQMFFTDNYPVLAHRYLMLNGFSASFIAGFLMTAVPKFSQTKTAETYEVLSFISMTILGIIFAYLDNESFTFIISSLQAFLILAFLLSRVMKRQVNPPYSFVFIFVGLILWLVSGVMSILSESESFKILHYEGSIVAIILGVGSRLIPGILGHVDIVQTQRKKYENEKPFFLTVPLHFLLLILLFIVSYFLSDSLGIYLRTLVVISIGLFYWRLSSTPKTKSALTWCIWLACWFIIGSFVLKAFWQEGAIHASHAFFFSGILLLTLLVATRVLQSHGPKKIELEDSKVLYFVTVIILISGATRVSAFLMPDHYFRHLGYSALLATIGIGAWSFKYLRYVNTR